MTSCDLGRNCINSTLGAPFPRIRHTHINKHVAQVLLPYLAYLLTCRILTLILTSPGWYQLTSAYSAPLVVFRGTISTGLRILTTYYGMPMSKLNNFFGLRFDKQLKRKNFFQIAANPMGSPTMEFDRTAAMISATIGVGLGIAIGWGLKGRNSKAITKNVLEDVRCLTLHHEACDRFNEPYAHWKF